MTMAAFFAEAYNIQCYHSKQHACILLHNYPCADAIIVDHGWAEGECVMYRDSRLLPVSLATKSGSFTKRCVMVRFIPHRLPKTQSSTSRLYELAIHTKFELPSCTARDFILIGMEGGIPQPGKAPELDHVVLLPSTQTALASTECSRCESAIKLNDEDLNLDEEQCYLSQQPFLEADTAPLSLLYQFGNGSVHTYLKDIFRSEDCQHLVMPISGRFGVLHKQWSHGDARRTDRPHPSTAVLRRMSQSLTSEFSTRDDTVLAKFFEDVQKQTDRFMEERGIVESRAHRYALQYLTNETHCGLILRDLVKVAGFTTDMKLHCDKCVSEEDCKVLQPIIARIYAEVAGACCGACYLKPPCTIKCLPPALLQLLRQVPAFRADVLCRNCVVAGAVCEREACIAFPEDRDSGFCGTQCDMVHHDDGYKNVVSNPRTKIGYNAQWAAARD